MRCWRLLLHVELSEHLGVIVGIRESLTHAILDPVCSRGIYLIAFFKTVSSITLPFVSSIQAL